MTTLRVTLACLTFAYLSHWSWPWLTFWWVQLVLHVNVWMAWSFAPFCYSWSLLFYFSVTQWVYNTYFSFFSSSSGLTLRWPLGGLPQRQWEMLVAPALWPPQANHLTRQLLWLQTEHMLTGFVTISAVCSRQIRFELGIVYCRPDKLPSLTLRQVAM